ncbi:MAG: general secretion pathway protein GspM [Methylibium sp. NZG]|nr:MAG: general secretion pathway protein GspM [Methylibium sp. NZG]
MTALPPALAGLRQQAAKAWNGRTLRERQALALVAAVLGLFIVWALFVQPALTSLRAAPAQLDRLDAQMQQMQRLAAESRELRGVAPVSSSQAAAALKSATDRLGTAAKITLLGDRATLTLNGVSTEALRAWLSEARNAARARPVEAQLTRGPKGYSGTLSVNLAGAP